MGLAAALAAMPAIALERGVFAEGTYTAPGQLFTVQSPLGTRPIVIDSFDSSTGAVTFLDEEGAMFGVVCTPSYDVLAGADNDSETDLAILRNWFRDATFPRFFESQLPGSLIMHEEPGTLGGLPAWFGVVYLPHGSARLERDGATGETVRADSYRGVVVFSRGDLTFLLMTEVEPERVWTAYVPTLTAFYGGMAFTAPARFPYVAQAR